MKFDDVARPRVPSPWRIRNDGHQVVVYQCTTGGLTYKVLSAQEASLVPLLDGSLTVADLRCAWCQIHSEDGVGGEADAAVFEATLERLASSAGPVALEGEPSPSFTSHADGLVPDFGRYCETAERLARPLAVNVAPTTHCRTDCRYCYAERDACEEMTLAELRPLFDELAENEIYIVDIAGTDIFARRDALDMLQEMVAREFVFFLSTKCSFSEATAHRLAGLGIGLDEAPAHLERPVQLSVDSADPDVASFLVRRPDYLESMIRTTRRLKRAGMAPRIKAVLTPFNLEAPEGLVQTFQDLGVADFQFVQYGRSYYRHDDALFLSAEHKRWLHDTIQDVRQRFPAVSIQYQDDLGDQPPSRQSWKEWEDRAVCSGGRLAMLVHPNGEVTLCDQVPRKPPFVVGRVQQEGVMGVWQSSRLIEFLYPSRDRFAGTVCYECTQFDACHRGRGYCYRDALFVCGNPFDAPPECPRQSKVGLRQI